MIVARATRGYAAAACRSCVLSAIVVVVAVTIVEIHGGGWYQLVAVDKSRIVCRVWPNRVECCRRRRLLARDSGVVVRRRLFSQDGRRRRWGFDGAGGLDVVWRAILVVFVVGVGGGGRLIDEMRFWWWASANYSESAAAVAVATKRTGRRRTVFPTCFFFRPRISANKRGGRAEFSEPKDFKVGTVAAAVAVFGFFFFSS